MLHGSNHNMSQNIYKNNSGFGYNEFINAKYANFMKKLFLFLLHKLENVIEIITTLKSTMVM